MIPPKHRLCVELGVSLSSVVRALARLTGAGVAFSVRARGTVIVGPGNLPTGPTLRVRTPSRHVETWTLPSGQGARIRDVVTARVKDGTYPEGSRIPGMPVLAEEFGTTEGTAKHALKPLKKQGILAGTRQGGTLVPPLGPPPPGRCRATRGPGHKKQG
ncbi:GntR family transcriptional regulator [Streptomyces mirabilis]|uniref:GntR family transcriptional regulator n=1 Tax=Streptomyces mirabilis TaxID=68239 RepID=A0ABU3UXU4_9ACTN|nr:GntR family transcriptional regulator [Streptomyces mirabilis]MDU8998746.1 GntR family transcriptional regulator [Streptomyces mirabilis]